MSVLFVAYILFSVGMAYRPWGHGSAPLAGPLFTAFDAVAALRPAHGAEIVACPLGEANAGPHEEGVERVNSRSSPGVLAVRDTTPTSDREFGPGGGSSEPLDPDSYVHLVNSSRDTSPQITSSRLHFLPQPSSTRLTHLVGCAHPWATFGP